MVAVILAGGKGTRLRPYTVAIPKPLVPLGDKAVIEILMDRLIHSGVEEVNICLGHHAELIMAYLGDGQKYGIQIRYFREEIPLGTVAPIRNVSNLPENFLVMNGDLLTDLDFRKLFDYHFSKDSMLTVATYRRHVHIDFGVIESDPESQAITGFREKPDLDFDVSMGVYAMNRKVLEFIPDGKPFGFDELVLSLLQKKVGIHTFLYEGYWLDIGRPEDYEKANQDVSSIEG